MKKSLAQGRRILRRPIVFLISLSIFGSQQIYASACAVSTRVCVDVTGTASHVKDKGTGPSGQCEVLQLEDFNGTMTKDLGHGWGSLPTLTQYGQVFRAGHRGAGSYHCNSSIDGKFESKNAVFTGTDTSGNTKTAQGYLGDCYYDRLTPDHFWPGETKTTIGGFEQGGAYCSYVHTKQLNTDWSKIYWCECPDLDPLENNGADPTPEVKDPSPEPGANDCGGKTSADSQGQSGNPVNWVLGTKEEHMNCMNMNTGTGHFALGLSYDTASANRERSNGILGKGWAMGHTQTIGFDTNQHRLFYHTAADQVFTYIGQDTNGDTTIDVYYPETTLDANTALSWFSPQGTDWQLIHKRGDTETFNSNGQITQRCDASNHCVHYSYDGNDRLSNLALWLSGASSATRSVNLGYGGNGLVETVTEGSRQISLGYSSANQLASISRPDQGTTTYVYGTGSLSGYIVEKRPANMQMGSGTEVEGWYIGVTYESQKTNGVYRVARETWYNDAGNPQHSQRFVWGSNQVAIETYGSDGTTLQRSVTVAHDEKFRITRTFIPGSTSLYSETIYCDSTLFPVACPNSNSRNRPYQHIAPDGSSLTYQYDDLGRVLTVTRQ